MKALKVFAFALIMLPASFAMAKDFPVQGRLFIGSASVDPSDVNTEFTAQSLENFDNVTQYGVEMLYPVSKLLEVGLRYTKRYVHQEEDPENPATDYYGQIDQDSAMAIVRVPFIHAGIFRADVFAGFGGTNTTLKIKTATQDGKLTKKDSGSWFASTCSSFGASAAIGYKQFYFYVEGEVDSNKVDGFKRSGTINNNIDAIDLSGSYFTVGFLFAGISASKK